MLRSQLFRTRVRLLGRYVSASWLAAYVLLFIWLISPHFPAALRLERPVQLGILLLLIADVAWGLGWLFRGGGSKPYKPLVSPSELDWKCTLGEYYPAKERHQHGYSLGLWWLVHTVNNGALWLLCALNAMFWSKISANNQLFTNTGHNTWAHWDRLGTIWAVVQQYAWQSLSASVLTLTLASIAFLLVTALFTHPTTRYGTSSGVVARAAFGHRGGRILFCTSRIVIALVVYGITSAFGAACLAEAVAGMSTSLWQLADRLYWAPPLLLHPSKARGLGKCLFYLLQIGLLFKSGPLARQQSLVALTPYGEEMPLWGLLHPSSLSERGASGDHSRIVPSYARSVANAIIVSRTVAPILWFVGSLIALYGLVPTMAPVAPATLWNRSVWSGLLEQVAAYRLFDPSMMLPLTSLVASALALPLLTYGDVAKSAKDQMHQLVGVAVGVVPAIFFMSYVCHLLWGTVPINRLEYLFAPTTLVPGALSWTRTSAAFCFATAILLSNNAIHLLPARRSLEKFLGHGLLTRVTMAALALSTILVAASPLGTWLFLRPTSLQQVVLPLLGSLGGSLTGIIAADYFLFRRTSLRFLDLYREWDSAYWYDIRGRGEHETAYFAYKLSLGIAAVGLIQFLSRRLVESTLRSPASVHSFLLRWFSAPLTYSLTQGLMRFAKFLLRMHLSWIQSAWGSAFLFGFVFAGGSYYLICFVQRRWHIPFAALLRIIFLGSPFPYSEGDADERRVDAANRPQ
jgi:cytosine/uracil/thiamine/allantoin permease